MVCGGEWIGVHDQVWLTQYVKGQISIGFFSLVRWVVSIRYSIIISTTRPVPSLTRTYMHTSRLAHTQHGVPV